MAQPVGVIAEPDGPMVPAFPVTTGNDAINVYQYAQPVLTDWQSPSAIGLVDGLPQDSFPGLANNPDIPGPWNRTTDQQQPGVKYNHDSNYGVMTSGTGSMHPATDFSNNMGGLITLFPDGRYMSRTMTEDEGSSQYVIWTEPLPSSGQEPGLLTQFILP